MSPGLWISVHIERSNPREKGQERITHLIEAKRETRLTLFEWPNCDLCESWLNSLLSFYCVLKRTSRFWTRRSERSKQHLAQYDAQIAKTFILKPSALQQSTLPAIQYVSQSRLCLGFAAEHGTKQVIPNQPPHQTAMDARSGMPNKKLNSLPGPPSSLTSGRGTDGASDSEECQKALISQQWPMSWPCDSLSSEQMIFFKDISVNLMLVGKHDSVFTDNLSFCNPGKDNSILQFHLWAPLCEKAGPWVIMPGNINYSLGYFFWLTLNCQKPIQE